MTRMRVEDEHGTGDALADVDAKVAAHLVREGDEVFLAVVEGPDLRFGVSAQMTSGGRVRYILEAMISVLRRGRQLEFDSSERALRVARAMEARGYALTHNDDGWIVCELEVEREAVGPECDHIRCLLSGHPGEKENEN